VGVIPGLATSFFIFLNTTNTCRIAHNHLIMIEAMLSLFKIESIFVSTYVSSKMALLFTLFFLSFRCSLFHEKGKVQRFLDLIRLAEKKFLIINHANYNHSLMYSTDDVTVTLNEFFSFSIPGIRI
jgi:hypothetical protein